jgi:hypothetical protein
LLTAAGELFRARRALHEAAQRAEKDPASLRRLRHEVQALSQAWHASFSLAGPEVAIAQQAAQHRLSRLDREVLAGLLLGQLGLLPGRPGTVAEILAAMALPGSKTLAGLRAVSEHGRLCRAELIIFDDPDEDIAQRTAVVEPTLVEAVLAGKPLGNASWHVAGELELFGRLQSITRALMRKSDALRNMCQGYGSSGEFVKWTRKAYRLLGQLGRTIALHPAWKLNALRQEKISNEEWFVFLALLGSELLRGPDREEHRARVPRGQGGRGGAVLGRGRRHVLRPRRHSL